MVPEEEDSRAQWELKQAKPHATWTHNHNQALVTLKLNFWHSGATHLMHTLLEHFKTDGPPAASHTETSQDCQPRCSLYNLQKADGTLMIQDV